MSKKPVTEPREVEVVVAPAGPLTPQAAQEIARFVAASKRKQKRRRVSTAVNSPRPLPTPGK